jgi:hypothetical protein
MQTKPVPKDRASLKGGDWFPHVFSKVAPLEWWSYCDSASDLQPNDFPDAILSRSVLNEAARSPVFSFSFFRPKPGAYMKLIGLLESYRGAAYWSMCDANISAYKRKPTFQGMIAITSEEVRQKLEKEFAELLTPDPDFVQQCVEDIPALCAYIEKQLGLEGVAPTDFSEAWLTAEGLAHSRGEFEDFLDRGSHLPYLARDPDRYAKDFKPTSEADIDLHICVSLPSVETRTGPNSSETRPATGVSQCPLLLDFPPPWDDGIYKAEQIPDLLAELRSVQNYAEDPALLRALDNFIRVANWANKLNLGIFLSGQ